MIIPECMNEWLPLNGWMSDYPYMDECMITPEWMNIWSPLNGWMNDWLPLNKQNEWLPLNEKSTAWTL